MKLDLGIGFMMNHKGMSLLIYSYAALRSTEHIYNFLLESYAIFWSYLMLSLHHSFQRKFQNLKKNMVSKPIFVRSQREMLIS